MAIVRPLGTTSSSGSGSGSKNNGLLETGLRIVERGADAGFNILEDKVIGKQKPAQTVVYQTPPPPPAKKGFFDGILDTTGGKLAALAIVTKLLKVW